MNFYKIFKIWSKPNETLELDFDLYRNAILNFSIKKSCVWDDKKPLGWHWELHFMKFALKHYYHPF